MDKKIELTQKQIEEIVDSSNMNLSEEQRNKMIANLKNGKKSPSTLIMNGDIESLQVLIDEGLDVNETNFLDTPLLALAIIYSDIDIVKLLIENGADIKENQLLAFALMFGDIEIIKLLIENGANIEFQNNSSLLEQALLFSNTEIIELCIEKSSKFPQHILFDVVQRKDGYIFDRKDIEKIIDNKKKLRTELYDSEEIYESIISKHSQESNKRHSRLNKIRRKMTNITNKFNDMQDNMTLLTIIDFIKIFIKYGGDVNYKDENGSTALMLLSYFGYEDCVKLLIENGAEIDIQNSGIETPLLLAYENNHFNVVKLLIDSGANVNIIMDNDESFYKKAKYDNKHYEVHEWIENSPTYVKITHDPKELVKILSNFTIDKPIKYTTHTWDFGELKKEYGDFDGYMNAVKNQFDKMKTELEELSPNLYKKIYTFLIEENPDENYSWCSKANINIGWSSLDGLKEHCNSGNNPFDFKLPKTIAYEVDFETITINTFEGVINLFKQEIEIRDNFKNLENLFANKVDTLGENFYLDLSTAKLGRQFYTDTQKFSNVLDKIFYDMSTREKFPNIKVNTTELEDRSIELKITQIDSSSSRSADELLERANIAGDISEIKQSLMNLCDWSIESSFEDENFRVNFLHSNNVKDIEILETKPLGFTYILRFYK